MCSTGYGTDGILVTGQEVVWLLATYNNLVKALSGATLSKVKSPRENILFGINSKEGTMNDAGAIKID